LVNYHKENLSFSGASPTVKELEAFHLIVRLGGFTAAAAHLKTTQAAVSARIRELQNKLGVQLFERRQRRAKLTVRGRALLPYAERMSSLTKEITHRFVSGTGIKGVVRVGIPGSITAALLPKLMRRVATHHPNVEVEFFVDLSANLAQMVTGGLLDLAIMASHPTSRDVTTEVVGRMPMCWVASRALEMPSRVLEPAEFASWPIISDIPGSYIHQLILRWFKDGGVEPRTMHGCSNVSARMGLIRAGLGVGPVPATAISNDRASGLRTIGTRPALPEMEYFLAYSAAAREPTVDLVMRHMKALLAMEPNFKFSGFV